MALYYGEIYGGRCTLIEARNERQAWAELRREEGTANAKGVRKATKEDVAWIEGMGGWVPAAHRTSKSA